MTIVGLRIQVVEGGSLSQRPSAAMRLAFGSLATESNPDILTIADFEENEGLRCIRSYDGTVYSNQPGMSARISYSET